MRRGLDRTALARAARTLGRTIADRHDAHSAIPREPVLATAHDLKEAVA
jgi:hypothetical protein